ncbi:MAG: hypothetical protein WC805_00950 [Patescibacteria group bacterium]|jgi:hypothetical protein
MLFKRFWGEWGSLIIIVVLAVITVIGIFFPPTCLVRHDPPVSIQTSTAAGEADP